MKLRIFKIVVYACLVGCSVRVCGAVARAKPLSGAQYAEQVCLANIKTAARIFNVHEKRVACGDVTSIMLCQQNVKWADGVMADVIWSALQDAAQKHSLATLRQYWEGAQEPLRGLLDYGPFGLDRTAIDNRRFQKLEAGIWEKVVLDSLDSSAKY